MYLKNFLEWSSSSVLKTAGEVTTMKEVIAPRIRAFNNNPISMYMTMIQRYNQLNQSQSCYPLLNFKKKALNYLRGLNVDFFVCLNAGDKTCQTFLNLQSADYFASFESLIIDIVIQQILLSQIFETCIQYLFWWLYDFPFFEIQKATI